MASDTWKLLQLRLRNHLPRMLGVAVLSTAVAAGQMIEENRLPRLDGEEREFTALFSDIRGFSSFSETFQDNPRELVRVLNQYLTRVSTALLREGGCLDKYIGDAVVCLFGAPVDHSEKYEQHPPAHFDGVTNLEK